MISQGREILSVYYTLVGFALGIFRLVRFFLRFICFFNELLVFCKFILNILVRVNQVVFQFILKLL